MIDINHRADPNMGMGDPSQGCFVGGKPDGWEHWDDEKYPEPSWMTKLGTTSTTSATTSSSIPEFIATEVLTSTIPVTLDPSTKTTSSTHTFDKVTRTRVFTNIAITTSVRPKPTATRTLVSTYVSTIGVTAATSTAFVTL